MSADAVLIFKKKFRKRAFSNGLELVAVLELDKHTKIFILNSFFDFGYVILNRYHLLLILRLVSVKPSNKVHC